MSNEFIDALPHGVRAAATIAFNCAADIDEWGTGEPYGIIGAAIMAHATEVYAQALNDAAAIMEKHDLESRGFIPGSLWDTLSREGAARIRGLNKVPAPWPTFQARVRPWMLICFGEAVAADRLERDDRFLEEVLELLQTADYPRERIAALVDYVYGRTKGEQVQETGGVMVTLAARCLAYGIDMHVAGDIELARIWTKVETIRAKQAAKPVGSALPVAVATHPDDLAVDRFAAAMKAKLAQKRAEGYGGWNDPVDAVSLTLARMLVEHIPKGDPVDVANYAMMLHQRQADPTLLTAQAVAEMDAMVERACRSRYSAFDDWSDELKTEERYRISAALRAALGG
jgi:hypothetical protein